MDGDTQEETWDIIDQEAVKKVVTGQKAAGHGAAAGTAGMIISVIGPDGALVEGALMEEAR